jgi:hypothetical protein
LWLSGRFLGGLYATIGLWSRFHGAGGPIPSDIDLRDSSNMIAGFKASVAAGSIVVGHLQVPGESESKSKQLPKLVRAKSNWPDRR